MVDFRGFASMSTRHLFRARRAHPIDPQRAGAPEHRHLHGERLLQHDPSRLRRLEPFHPSCFADRGAGTTDGFANRYNQPENVVSIQAYETLSLQREQRVALESRGLAHKESTEEGAQSRLRASSSSTRRRRALRTLQISISRSMSSMRPSIMARIRPSTVLSGLRPSPGTEWRCRLLTGFVVSGMTLLAMIYAKSTSSGMAFCLQSGPSFLPLDGVENKHGSSTEAQNNRRHAGREWPIPYDLGNSHPMRRAPFIRIEISMLARQPQTSNPMR